VWKELVQLAHYRKQRIQVFFFPGQVSRTVTADANIRRDLLPGLMHQVGQGKIKWDDCAEQALLRDKVMGAWPKDDAGWPKKMSAGDEAAYVAGLSEKERHCVVGLGGSQKAEVAWLDAQGIPYEELDVGEFSLKYMTLVQSERAADSGDSNDAFVYNPMAEAALLFVNPVHATTFNVNPGAVGLENEVGNTHGTPQRKGSWSVSRIESGNEVSSELEVGVGGDNEQEEGKVLPENTNPILDHQHIVTSTAGGDEHHVI
jgi:hypothetical protein